MAVTRDDVARAAGVSTAVVSYVLNDGPRPVSASSRTRVLAAIEQLGYRRDSAARTLAGGRSHTLGLVLPDLSFPYFADVAQQISTEADRRGYEVLVATTGWDPDAERRRLQAMAGNRVEAVILMSGDPLQDDAALRRLGMPVAIVDRPGVAVAGAEAVTAHLLSHGHRRVGLVGGPPGLISTVRRELGWQQAQRAAGIRPSRSRIVNTATTELGGYDAVERLLLPAARCTAIFVETDVQAVGVLRRLHDLGVTVPGDVDVATMDSTALAQFSVPSITGLAQQYVEVGRRAVTDVLVEGVSGVLRVDVAGFDIVPRESCGHPDR